MKIITKLEDEIPETSEGIKLYLKEADKVIREYYLKIHLLEKNVKTANERLKAREILSV